ncbi:MAG: helix-turn-helix domain-containing protein [Patescibacteria group bacterium]
MQSKLIKIGEAAELLGVSIDTLRRWDRSGKFPSVRTGDRGYRFYRFSDIEFKLNSVSNHRNLSREWAQSPGGFLLDSQLHCRTRDVFQARLETLQSQLVRIIPIEIVSLVIAVAGEIGNNSFDHNLGNWSDMMGIFFYYDEKNRSIILADRGQGILSTLKRVKPELDSDKKALRVAFTEIISGRHPEARGNGLKFVKSVIVNNPFLLDFQTGNAFLHLKQNDKKLSIQEVSTIIKGCFATIKIKK